MNYAFSGGSIEIPNTWLDRSIHSFVEDTGDGTGKSSLVIHQVSIEKTLDDFVDQQLVQAGQKLSAYKLHRCRKVNDYFEISYEWSPAGDIIIQQRQLFVARSRFMIVVVTLTTTSVDTIRTDGLWSAFVASLHVSEVMNA